MKRSLAVVPVAMVLVVAGIGVGVRAWSEPSPTPEAIEAALAQRLHREIEVGRVQDTEDGLNVQGLTIHNPDGPDDEPWVVADDVELSCSFEELSRPTQACDVTLRNATVRVSFDQGTLELPTGAALDLTLPDAHVLVRDPDGVLLVDLGLDLKVWLNDGSDREAAQAMITAAPATLEVAGVEFTEPTISGSINSDGSSDWTATTTSSETLGVSALLELRAVDGDVTWALSGSASWIPLGVENLPFVTRLFPLAAGSRSLDGQLKILAELTGTGLTPEQLSSTASGEVYADLPTLDLSTESLLGRLGEHAGAHVEQLRIYALSSRVEVADGWLTPSVTAKAGDVLPFTGRVSMAGGLELRVDLQAALKTSGQAAERYVDVVGTIETPLARW